MKNYKEILQYVSKQAFDSKNLESLAYIKNIYANVFAVLLTKGIPFDFINDDIQIEVEKTLYRIPKQILQNIMQEDFPAKNENENLKVVNVWSDNTANLGLNKTDADKVLPSKTSSKNKNINASQEITDKKSPRVPRMTPDSPQKRHNKASHKYDDFASITQKEKKTVDKRTNEQTKSDPESYIKKEEKQKESNKKDAYDTSEAYGSLLSFLNAATKEETVVEKKEEAATKSHIFEEEKRQEQLLPNQYYNVTKYLRIASKEDQSEKEFRFIVIPLEAPKSNEQKEAPPIAVIPVGHKKNFVSKKNTDSNFVEFNIDNCNFLFRGQWDSDKFDVKILLSKNSVDQYRIVTEETQTIEPSVKDFSLFDKIFKTQITPETSIKVFPLAMQNDDNGHVRIIVITEGINARIINDFNNPASNSVRLKFGENSTKEVFGYWKDDSFLYEIV